MDTKLNPVKPGRWMWDEYTEGLLWICQEREKQVIPLQVVATVISISSTGAGSIMKEGVFKHSFGNASITRFKKYCERKVSSTEPNVVILQDCKDVALFSCDVKLLTPEFITLFHTRVVDKFLRSLIIYFQYYIQIWNKLQFRRIEEARKLRTPLVRVVEDIMRDDLADLRCMVARDYAAILTGVGDAKKFHHLKSENNVSLSDKDRKQFEMLIKMSTRVVWIALRKKKLLLIEKELNRLLRTKFFSPIEHNPSKKDQFVTLPIEQRILEGRACKTEKKLLHRSPCIQELILDTHDYRMLAIGVTDIEDRNERQDYLEIAYTAPEELIQDLDAGIGLLGVYKKFLDPVLNEEISTTRKRSSVMKPIPEFALPPYKPYDDTKIYETLPRRPCKYHESPASINARRDQCKMWTEYVNRHGQPISGYSITDKLSTISYSTIRSKSKEGSVRIAS